jgi:aldehyde dehydrogenase (NAD+)
MTNLIPLSANHRDLVKIGPTELLIDGEFRQALSGKTFSTIDPATEESIAEVSEAMEEDVDLAVRAAHNALENGTWHRMDARERGRLIYKWADLIQENSRQLALLESLDNGKPISDSLSSDLPGAVEVLRYFAGWADKIQGKTIPTSGPRLTFTKREPVGVCGLIIPWNYPMNMAAWKLGPALASGCTTVLKPAEQTPLTALLMGQLALEAGIPAGVLNIVPGFGPTAGAALVRHPLVNKIAFTGEGATAQIIKRETLGTMKRLSFELGGKSPNIILKDADLDEAVEGAFGAIFSNMGQNCCAGSRVFVQAQIYDDFVEKLAALASKRVVGDPFDERTEHGAQIDKAQFEKILHYVDLGKKEGATCVAGGQQVFERGFFVAPTVFAGVADEMSIARDEIFGPVASVLRFEELNEVVKRANDTPYGLAAGVWTRDIHKAHAISDELKAGTVWINCYNAVDPAAPFGGFKMSGLGRELGEQAFDAYTETKTVTMLQRSLDQV